MIRMLKAWNGYPQQAIVSLSGSEETRLVGLGLASFDIDGEADAEFLVKAKTNPLTGGIGITSVDGRGVGLPLVVSGALEGATANRIAIQKALNFGGHVVVSGKPGTTIYTDTTLVQGDGTTLTFDGASHQCIAPVRLSNVRVGNAEVFLDDPRGIIPLCADAGAEQIYSLDITINGAAKTATLRTDAGTGTPVSIAGASAKFALSDVAGRSLYIRTISAQLPTANGTYTVRVYVSPNGGARVVAASRVSGTTTITEAGHGRVTGDVVTFFGTGFDGTFFVNVIDADTFSFADARADASATIKSYSVKNVGLRYINGAVCLSGSSTTTYSPHCCLNQFFAVNNLEITGVYKAAAGGKYASIFQACSRVFWHDLEFPNTASDGFTSIGPMSRVKMRRATGKNGDNMFGLGTSNTDNLLYIAPGEAGSRDYLDADIKDIKSFGSTQEPIRLFGSVGAKHGSIKVSGMRGSITSSVSCAVWALVDSMVLQGTAGAIDSLYVDDVDLSMTAGVVAQTVRVSGAQTVGKIFLGKMSAIFDSAGQTLANNCGLLNVNGSTVDRIVIDDVKVAGSATGTVTRLVKFENSTTIPTQITVTNSDLSQMEQIVSIGNNAATANGSTIVVEKSKLTNCQYVVGTGTVTGTFNISWNDLFGTGGTNLLNSGSTTGTINCFGRGLSGYNTKQLNYYGTGATVSSFSIELQANVTKLTRTNGSSVFNTNTAAGTLAVAGVVICDSTNAANSWKLATDFTKAY